MYYLIYEIENLLNGKKYRGKHKTKNLDDEYMGSGLYIKRAINKYGLDNFKKTIIFMAFDEDSMNYMEKIEFVNSDWISLGPDFVYNLKVGGLGGFSTGFVTTDKGTQISKLEFDSDDSIFGVAKGKVPVIDQNGNRFSISTTNETYLSGNLVPCMNKNGTVSVIVDGKFKRITKDEYASGNYIHCSSGRVSVKDKFGNTMSVYVTDERFINGELVGVSKGISKTRCIYEIYSSDDKLMYTVDNIKLGKFLKDNNLPSVLGISQKNNGSPIYTNVHSNYQRLVDKNLIQYQNWYCLRIQK